MCYESYNRFWFLSSECNSCGTRSFLFSPTERVLFLEGLRKGGRYTEAWGVISMDSLVSFHASDSDTSLESSREKRREIEAESQSPDPARTEVRWRSQSSQRMYSIKLVEALQRSSQKAPPAPSRYAGGRAVRDVADRVLAMAAKGRTRWSRAILASRLRLSILRRHRKVMKPRVSRSKPSKPLPTAVEDRKRRSPAVEDRVNALSRLVPGCKGAPVVDLLEETGDYIAALEMQIRAMTTLTEILSGPQSDRIGSRSSSREWEPR